MSALLSVFQRLARGADGRGLTLDPAMSTLDVLTILWRTGWNFMRGCRLRAFASHSAGPVLVAKGAQVSHARRLTLGHWVKIEDYAEVHCLSSGGVQLGDRVTIGRGASIRPSSYYGGELGSGLSVGAGSSIGAYSWIGASGQVDIGSNVLLGPRVVVIPENHRFSSVTETIRSQGVERAAVTIEDDCWLGANAVVLSGVRIGRGSIVASGAVVTRDVEPFSIVGGVPARLIRTRLEEAA